MGSSKPHSSLLEDARERHFGQEPSHRDVPPNWCPICGIFEQLQEYRDANAVLRGQEQEWEAEKANLEEQLEAAQTFAAHFLQWCETVAAEEGSPIFLLVDEARALNPASRSSDA